MKRKILVVGIITPLILFILFSYLVSIDLFQPEYNYYNEYRDEGVFFKIPTSIVKDDIYDIWGKPIGTIQVKGITIDKVIITSLNPNIASIDGSGVITLKEPYNKGTFKIKGNDYGEATIVALVDDQEFSVKTHVIPPPETKVETKN